MKNNLARLGFGEEVNCWFRSIGYEQAIFVLKCLARLLEFANERGDFFQNCGVYVVGSSIMGGNFNDIDIVLVGLDFRAVVSYDKIFLMDPETLIEQRILIEPVCFLIMSKSENGLEVLLPATDPSAPDNIEVFGRMGLEHNGIRYDYNFDSLVGDSLTLEGYCSYHAQPSPLMKSLNKLFCEPNKSSLNCPFDNYGFGGEQKFLVYRFSIEYKDENLPGVKGSIINEIKPIDFCIHAENLRREEWKKHQSNSGLQYLTLMEWSQTSHDRKIITELDYPRFIDPDGAKRAKWDPMICQSFNPGRDSNVITIEV